VKTPSNHQKYDFRVLLRNFFNNQTILKEKGLQKVKEIERLLDLFS